MNGGWIWAVPMLLVAAMLPWSQGPRRSPTWVRLPGPGRPALGGPGRGDAGTGRTGRTIGGRWSHLTRRLRRRPEVDLGAILTEVAARLQAGAATGAAWAHALPDTTARAGASVTNAANSATNGAAVDGAPAQLEQLVPPAPRIRRARAEDTTVAHQVAGAQVACRVAHRLGAPLAQVLEACAGGVSEAGRAQGARRTALAAPRATARLLGWLPLAGLALGSAWGADPLQVLLGGGWGSWCLVGGAALMLAGHVWSAKLVRTAEGAGS